MIAQNPTFIKFWLLGYRNLVPVVPPQAPLSPRSTLHTRMKAGKDPRGKAVGVKGDDGMWRGFNWLQAPAATDADIAAWQAMGASVGIRTGGGLVALDIDSLDDDIAYQAVHLLMEMVDPTGKTHFPLRIGKAPKCLIMLRVTEPVPYQRVEFTGHQGKPERIELLSDDRQFVADGIHATTGKPYTWPSGIPAYADLPLLTPTQLDAYFDILARSLPAATRPVSQAAADRSTIDQSALTGDLERVREAVTALPNTSALFPTYDDYIRVGAAIKGATQQNPHLGASLFVQWAEKWEGENDAETALADYGQIKPPYELGANWLYDMADRHGTDFQKADDWFDVITDSENPFAIALAKEEAVKPKRKFTITSLKDAAEAALTSLTSPLVKGLLDQGAASVLYGRSNSGKTFVAMDIAFHIAAGLPWGKMKTHQMPVLYVAAEGGAGARKRAAALTTKYGAAAAETAKFHFLLSSIDLFHPEADTKPLIDTLLAIQQHHDQPVGLTVIDTLARAMTGGDENSAQDMGMLVKHIDAIRAATGSHVLIIHHSGKDATKGARGSNALLGAVDTEIEIAENQISVTKQRDIDKSWSSAFELEVHLLGEDSDGDPITSCTVKLTEQAGIKVGQPTPREQDIVDAVETLQATQPGVKKGVSLNDLTTYFSASGSSEMTKGSIKINLLRMLEKNLIVRSGRGLFAKSSVVPFDFLDDEEEDENTAGTKKVQSGQDVFS